MLKLLKHFVIPVNYNTFVSRLTSNSTQVLENIDREKKLKIIELEIDIMRQEGRKVPSKLSKTEWNRILDLNSISARRKYLTFLFTCEMKNQNKQSKKEQFKLEREEILAERRKRAENNEIVYGLGYNSYLLKIYETTINSWNNKKLINAMQFEQKLVIDCSYDQYMSFREADNCAKQLTYTFAINRLHTQPFDIHFCNFDKKSKSGQKMMNSIPTMFNMDFPINVHEKSYIELFDRNRLVYLTPHCKNTLTEYSHDDIYIVGAMVDKANNEPISLSKAKKNDIRMAKLPLDHFLNWGKGGKSLTINQMLEILLEMKVTNDWDQALRFVPRRKLFKDLQSGYFSEELREKKVNHVNKNMKNISRYEDYNDNKKFVNAKKEYRHFQNYFGVDTWGKPNKKSY